MKPFIASLIVIAVISVAADFILSSQHWSSKEVYSTSNVRLD